MFGPTRVEVKGWRKLHNDELPNVYSFPNIIRTISFKYNEMSGACNTHGGGEKCVQNFGWKLERPRCRWEYNIKK
jgi:hypothetical protein